MLNKVLLNNKYSNFISDNKSKFIEEVDELKSMIDFSSIKNKSLLVYNKNKRNQLIYLFSIYNSLLKDRILDYTVITGQSLINQHFLSESMRDNNLYDGLHYDDLAFIILSQFDYTSEYLESLIIDLIEFRSNMGKITIVLYDVLDSAKQSYTDLTRKIQAYFVANNFKIVDITTAAPRQISIKKRGRIEWQQLYLI